MYGSRFTFHPARVSASRDETPLMRSLRLEVDADVAGSHEEAGQFVEVRLPGESSGGFFAIANAPDGRSIELLIKRGQGLPDELAELGVGAIVETSAAMGRGFPVAACRGKSLLLFATGSGFAPIRAVLQEVARLRDAFGRVDLFFGVRSGGEFPYEAELRAWESAGIRVHRAVSRPAASEEAYAGYVQQRFREALPPVEDAVAMLCGLQGMIEGVTEALLQAGMPPDRILQNV
ncbi:ferredoxin--NADP reductase [Vulgatibacter incomptus]|uniref:Heterodisulfide reductase, cytochrome reductase subunit n=1 Tax=Vulgatibacter incomptus TaxID=1391653 RepID=A0A0K1PI32_9BACT|nr:hypothetical protein [Vulgatibacter incomptus]AKU93066.1 Heterodisulfide reductase, cytochrome reductase subunit [Vulgatibacter incomptus]